MLRYKVQDVEKLILLYDLDEDEEEEVRSRFKAGEALYVYDDGSIKSIGEEGIIQPDEEGRTDEATFIREAERSGSEVEEVSEPEELPEEELGVLEDEER